MKTETHIGVPREQPLPSTQSETPWPQTPMRPQKKFTLWWLPLAAIAAAILLFSVVFDLFDVENKYRGISFALSTLGELTLAASMLVLFFTNKRRMSVGFKIACIVAVLAAVSPLAAPYIKASELTRMHGAQFEDGWQDLDYYKSCDYYQVVRYEGEGPRVYCSNDGISSEFARVADDEAAVIYVLDDHAAEVLVVFTKTSDGGWEMMGWGAIWSATGSADDFTWPLYR